MVCVVVGGGVVGLAVARRLARRGTVFLVERQRWLAQEQSSRNSEVLFIEVSRLFIKISSPRDRYTCCEVVHAGLYYPPGSLKARACRLGARLLYRFCGARGIRVQRRGKLIVGCAAACLVTT